MITQEQLPLVAIPSMNDTHLEEILLINKLDDAARKGDAKNVTTLLVALIEHTELHFSDEEDMMDRASFPAYQTHKGEHDRHLSELKALVAHFEKTQNTKSVFVYIEGSLTPWMLDHIKTMDTVTAAYIQK